jgi:multidrug efflux pump
VTRAYAALVRRIVAWPFVALLVLAAVGTGAWQIYGRLDSSFLPPEDQGVLMTMVNLPEGATTPQTQAVVEEIEDYLLNEESEAVETTFAALGFGFSGSGQNTAMLFVELKEFEEREGAELSAAAVAQRANMQFMGHRAGRVFFLQPPAIMGLGNSAGFSMYLVDEAGAGTEALQDAGDQLVALAQADGRVTSVRTDGTEDESALRINIDQQKAESFGLSLSSINAMLSVIFAGQDVNDFAMGSELRPVIVQGEAVSRMQAEDIESWYARNDQGEMVPFASFISTEWSPVAPSLSRIGGQPALPISGAAAGGTSSGQAMDAMESLVSELDGGWGVAWTDLSYQERQSGDQVLYLYALSVLVVFLCLAALYESWLIPLSVMLAVPVGVLGALTAAWLFSQSNDVYFKVGLLTTIGLAAKNAILIVEFARDLEAQGRAIKEAAVEAARLRLRPILMTSVAFMLGVTPLATATGAGAGAQNAIGIGVLGGTLTGTFIGIFMVPAFYVVVRGLAGHRSTPSPLAQAAE